MVYLWTNSRNTILEINVKERAKGDYCKAIHGVSTISKKNIRILLYTQTINPTLLARGSALISNDSPVSASLFSCNARETLKLSMYKACSLLLS